MYKSFLICVLIILSIIVPSCSKMGIVTNNHIYSADSRVNILQLQDSIAFGLDSETIPTIAYLQYLDTDTTQILAILNNYNHSIYMYDYVTQSLMKTVKIDSDSPQGFCIDNKLYSYSYSKGTLSVIENSDYSHQKTNTMILPEDRESRIFYPYPYATTLSPILKYEDYIVSIGYRSGEPKYENITNRPVLSLFDLKSEEITVAINYPELYSKNNWGGQMAYRLAYYTITPDGDIVVSFPASHNLVVSSFYDLSAIKNIFAGSRYIKEIRSYPASKWKVGISSSDVWKWYMENPSYQGVLYDKYRKVYYRIARLPDPDFKEGERGNNKPIVIIVLDDNFNYIGEYLLPKGPEYFPTNIFVSKEGLNIQVLTDNEDTLKFFIYEYVKKNN